MQGESSPDAARSPNQVAPEPSPATEPSRLPRKSRRFGFVHAAGLVVAIVAGIAVILIAMLPRPAPVLPPMSNSLGFWDRIPTPVVDQIPPVSNDTELWDRVPPEAHLAAQTHTEATADQAVSTTAPAHVADRSRLEEMTPPAAAAPAPCPPAAPDLNYQYSIQDCLAAASTTVLPPMSADVGYWSHVQDTRPAASTTNLSPTSSVMDFPERVPVVGGMRSYWDRPSASIAAAQSHLEMFRYTGQPALEEAHPATRSSLEIYRYTGEPALDDPGLASSTQPIRYPINVMR
jgi:hypothetical protein